MMNEENNIENQNNKKRIKGIKIPIILSLIIMLISIPFTFDMLFVADYVISDYSCIIYEAGVRNIPLYFYNFDFKSYKTKRGLALNYDELPGYTSSNPNELIKSLEKEYDMKYYKKFMKKYVENTKDCTKKVVEIIEEYMEEVSEFEEEHEEYKSNCSFDD